MIKKAMNKHIDSLGQWNAEKNAHCGTDHPHSKL